MQEIPFELMKEAKLKGFADRQIGTYRARQGERGLSSGGWSLGIERSYRLVDTCAAEFKAQTPYYYSTFLRGK